MVGLFADFGASRHLRGVDATSGAIAAHELRFKLYI